MFHVKPFAIKRTKTVSRGTIKIKNYIKNLTLFHVELVAFLYNFDRFTTTVPRET